jgi:DNA-binding MarR family transcriptional regulator
MTNEASLKFHMSMGMLINSAHRAMTKRFVQNAMKSGLDISLDQWMVLGPIWQLESASQKELGEITLKDKTSITRLVDILEKKNLVVRVEDQIDHRIKRVILTNAGKQLFFDVLPIMEKTREEVRKDISDQDIETFKKVLSSIIVNLEDEKDKPS